MPLKNLPRTYRDGDRFIKIQEPAFAAIEYAKTISARKIALSSGLFDVPEVLDYNASAGALVFERIADLVPLQVALCLPDMAVKVSAEAGVILAEIHRHMALPDEMKLPVPPELAMQSGPQVFIHGDFNLHNLCLSRGSGRVVVLDWSMTKLFGGSATFGTPCFDVAWFLYNIFSQAGGRWPRISTPPDCAKAFLQSYVVKSGADYGGTDYLEILQYAARLFPHLRMMRRNQLGRYLFLLEAGVFRGFEKWINASMRVPSVVKSAP